MYENGNKRKIRIDLPSFDMHKSRKMQHRNSTLFTVLSKFGIICLFFFIFTFCFSKFGKVVTKEYKESEFNTNITYIQKEILNYYEIGNIPQKNGDSSSLSLEELINNKIINKSKIDDIDKCDQKNSYVTLSKTRDNLYSLKIYLNCNGIIEEKEQTIKNL